jgi:hypothetical protein
MVERKASTEEPVAGFTTSVAPWMPLIPKASTTRSIWIVSPGESFRDWRFPTRAPSVIVEIQRDPGGGSGGVGETQVGAEVAVLDDTDEVSRGADGDGVAPGLQWDRLAIGTVVGLVERPAAHEGGGAGEHGQACRSGVHAEEFSHGIVDHSDLPRCKGDRDLHRNRVGLSAKQA